VIFGCLSDPTITLTIEKFKKKSLKIVISVKTTMFLQKLIFQFDLQKVL